DFTQSEDLLFCLQNNTPHAFVLTLATDGESSALPCSAKKAGNHLNARSLGPAASKDSQVWVHHVGSKDHELRYKIWLKVYRDHRCEVPLKTIDFRNVLTSSERDVDAGFTLQAKLYLTSAEVSTPDFAKEEDGASSEDWPGGGGRARLRGRWHRRALVVGRFEIEGETGFALEVLHVELILEDLASDRLGAPEVFVVGLGAVKIAAGEQPASPHSTRTSAERDAQAAEVARSVLRGHWRVFRVGANDLDGGTTGSWRDQLLSGAKEGSVLCLETRLELQYTSGPNEGIHRFVVQPASVSGNQSTAPSGSSRGQAKTSSASWQLQVSIPVLSVSWLHRNEEVLAARVKGLDLQVSSELGEGNLEISTQHFQIDHFIDGGELPVMLNRRFLHINSRWLGKKAVRLKLKWILGSHIIKKFEADIVPYWLNLEMGVLIRLYDLAESSFGFSFSEAIDPNQQGGAISPLEPPQLPISGTSNTKVEVWRLEKLHVEPLRLTVMVRSPDVSAVRDNPTARWIMRLAIDMPNMDLKLDKTILLDQFGSTQQFLGTLKRMYKRKATYSAVWSVFLSYTAAVLKGILNALWWLARGPYDASQMHRLCCCCCCCWCLLVCLFVVVGGGGVDVVVVVVVVVVVAVVLVVVVMVVVGMSSSLCCCCCCYYSCSCSCSSSSFLVLFLFLLVVVLVVVFSIIFVIVVVFVSCVLFWCPSMGVYFD
ncbi:unnamed protein product, partial [Polarella glacialis]